MAQRAEGGGDSEDSRLLQCVKCGRPYVALNTGAGKIAPRGVVECTECGSEEFAIVDLDSTATR
jgi:DNA-directed RNA polymerase subunit RPC12/RpoP